MSEHKLIVLDGVNKCGKGRNVQLLVDRLNDNDLPATSIREPGGTKAGEKIRVVLLDTDLEHTAESDTLLFAAARALTVRRIGELLVDQSVVADRSYLSTLAFQVHGDGADRQSVEQITEFALADSYQPAAFFVLDIPYETFIDRSKPNDGQDYFERDGDREYFERVRTGFLEEGEAIGAFIVNANRPLEEVHEEIWEHVGRVL